MENDDCLQITKVTRSYISHFDCGIESLNIYLRSSAKKNHETGLGKTFVYVEDRKVLGYYTISMGQIEFSSFPAIFKKQGMPQYPIPSARIGRLAVDKTAHKSGIGTKLLMNAFVRIWEAAENIGVVGAVVDSKNQSVNFYKKFGFIPFEDTPNSMFLPLNTIKELMDSLVDEKS